MGDMSRLAIVFLHISSIMSKGGWGGGNSSGLTMAGNGASFRNQPSSGKEPPPLYPPISIPAPPPMNSKYQYLVEKAHRFRQSFRQSPCYLRKPPTKGNGMLHVCIKVSDWLQELLDTQTDTRSHMIKISCTNTSTCLLVFFHWNLFHHQSN